jgi:hypothetical protein
MQFSYAYNRGEFAKAIADIQKPVAEAATGAMADAAQIAKTGGRASIASAGFSSRWQNALRANVYPAGGKTSLQPAALIYHKIAYSNVFETGAVIRGRPMLWLPIHENLPLQARGKQWTPNDFVAKVGPLRSVNVPGKPPMLAGKVAVGMTGATLALPSAAMTRKGKRARSAFAKQREVWKPLFIGHDAVSIRKKFNVAAAVDKARGQLGALYLKHLKT